MKLSFKIISGFLALILFFQASVGMAAFSDVPQDHPSREAIDALEKLDALPEAKNNRFLPRKKITRAEFIKMVLKVAEGKLAAKFRARFKDVPRRSPDAPYIYTALNTSAIDLPKNRLFHPRQPIRLIEALKIVFRLEGIPVSRYMEDPLGYKDIKRYTEDEALAAEALILGFVQPQSEKVFGARRRLTRAQAADLVYQIHSRVNIAKNLLQGIVPASIATSVNVTFSPVAGSEQLDILTTVFQIIQDRYLRAKDIDKKKIIYKAISALVKELEDPYSIYFEPKESKSFREALGGEIEGIGAYVEMKDGHVVVISPLKNSPAEKAGVKPNDIILKVNGIELKDMSISEAVDYIKGPRGTDAILFIKRGDNFLEITVKRDRVVIISVTLQMRDGTAILALNQFGEKTITEFRKLVEELKRQNAQNIILDMRNNSGGILDVSLEILGYFLESGQTGVHIVYGDQRIIGQRVFGTGELKDYPLVVLINKGSASAAEIVAGALQDYGRAKIIGETSFGKGTVQELTQFTDKSSLKLTIAKWLTPNKNEIDGVGVQPDIEVLVGADDERTGFDPVLERGMREARK